MRTTVTIEPDVARDLDRWMDKNKSTFKDAVNELLRRGLRHQPPVTRYKVEPFSSPFVPGIDQYRLNRLADQLEDAEALRKRKRSR